MVRDINPWREAMFTGLLDVAHVKPLHANERKRQVILRQNIPKTVPSNKGNHALAVNAEINQPSQDVSSEP